MDRTSSFHRKTKTRVILGGCICIVLVVLCLMHTREDISAALKEISPVFLAGVLFSKLMVQVANGYRFSLQLHLHQIKLPLSLWLPLSCVGTLQNAVLPGKTAMASKGIYLKHRFGLGYRHYLALTVTGNLLFLLTNAAILALLSGGLNRDLQLLAAGLFILSVMMVGVLGMVHAGIGGSNRITEGARSVSVLLFSKTHTRTVMAIIGSELALIGTRSLALWVCFLAAGAEPGPLAMVAISVLSSFSAIINLTPGNLGITESIIIGAAVIFDLPLEFALSASLISRVFSILSQALILFVTGKQLAGSLAPSLS